MKAYRTQNLQRDKLAPLEMVDRPVPEPADDEVQVKIVAAGVNRADYFVRMGWYSLDEEDKDNIGAEMAGIITKVGKNVSGWKVGDAVCAVTKHAGAYAEYAVTPAAFLLRIPEGITFEQAASLPVGLLTGWYNIFMKGGLKEDEKLLVQGGTSGMGILAIQMAREMGAKVYATAGGAEHCRVCEELGATAIDYKSPQRFEDYGPYKVIYDILGGGDYFRRNLECLEIGGNLRVLSFIGGGNTTSGIKLRQLHKPGGDFVVSRSKLLEAIEAGGIDGEQRLFEVIEAVNKAYAHEKDMIRLGGDATRRWDKTLKAQAVAQVSERIMPLIQSGNIKPMIQAVVPFAEAEKAHELIVGPHTGKIVLALSKSPQASR